MKSLRMISISALLVGWIAAGACSTEVLVEGVIPGAEDVLSLTVTPEGDTVQIGGTIPLSVYVEMENGAEPPPVIWVSLAPGVAAVTSTGTVTGLAAGTGYVRAQVGAFRDSAQVWVESVDGEPPPPPPPPGTLAGHYVTPGGSSSGDGTAANPWNLATALAGAGGRIRPGDTVWVRGGQ